MRHSREPVTSLRRGRLLRIAIRLASSLFVLLFINARQACAGPLRLVASGGPASAFGALTFSESDVDIQRPADLLDSDHGRVTFAREIESIIYQKKNGKMQYLSGARKSRVECLLPLSRSDRHRSVYAFNRYYSGFKFLTDAKLEDTEIYSRGMGSANAFARQFGRLRAGYFIGFSRDTGIGSSLETENRIEFLDAGTAILSVLKEKKQGFQFTLTMNRKFTAGYIGADDDISGSVNIFDSDDHYMIPMNLNGHRREYSLRCNLSPATGLFLFHDRGDYDSLDAITYNVTSEIGRWMSEARYRLSGLYLKKTAPHRATTFGVEDYDGSFDLAGTIDILGNQANLISGYFLFDAAGGLRRHTIKYATERVKGNYTFRYLYAYSTGDASVNFESFRRNLIFYTLRTREAKSYDFSEHQIGFGVRKNISKDTVSEYSVVQTIPILNDREEIPSAPTGTRKKTRGGTLHLLSLTFLF